MTYRIITNRGVVDFSADLKAAQNKYKRYCVDMVDGYCEYVYLISVDNLGKEEIICSARR